MEYICKMSKNFQINVLKIYTFDLKSRHEETIMGLSVLLEKGELVLKF
jgi:hypothetical protein